jgi:multidrug efflux system membrane fusion protein
MMSTSRRSATFGLLAACGAVLAALAGCSQEAPPPDLPLRAIQWERVSGALEGERRVISGVVTAIDETQLAFEVAGTILSVDVKLGDAVKKDQVLARLDPEPFELAVSDAEAGLAEARAQRAHARATLKRYQDAGEAVARQEVSRARAMRDSRESQYDAAEARLKLARRDLRLSVLVAPFRGSISAREVEPAMSVSGGQTIFEVDSDESGLRIEVQLPETLIARVRQGDEVEVSFPVIGDSGFDVGDRRFAAVVAEVGTRAGIGNAFPVRADLSDPPPGLRPGMTAEISFYLARGESELAGLEGLMIPIAAAVAEADDRFAVFVYDSDTSTVRKRPIRNGGVGDNTIAVLEGLEEGDIIATAGVSFLHDGQKVTLLDEHLIRNAP